MKVYNYDVFSDNSHFLEVNVVQRDTLVDWSGSEMAVIKKGNKKKTKKVIVDHILFEISLRNWTSDMAKRLEEKKKLPPIQLTEYQVQHLRYFVPTGEDSAEALYNNHIAGAYRLMGIRYMKAYVVDIIDLSDAPMKISLGNMMVLENADRKSYKIVKSLQSDTEKACVTIMGLTQTYSHIRDQQENRT